MQQTTQVTLTITWDNEEEDHPANWNWSELIDCHPDDVIVESD